MTAGILEAHLQGVVTSTSMMVGRPGWDDGVARLREAPHLGVGLHLNLLVGRPLVPAPSLTDATGAFASLAVLTRRALLGQLDADEIEAEAEAQFAAVRGALSKARGGTLGGELGATSAQPTHIDSHRHTHALPIARRAVARVAARHQVPLRRPVESHRWFPNDLPSQLHRGVIAWSWRLTGAGALPTRHPDHFIGVSMQGGDRFAAQLDAMIDRLPTGSVELMVHPGRVDDALTAVDGYTWQREKELAALTAPALRDRLATRGVALRTFAQL